MEPDFIVIGAGRSGTTSLYHYLSQHPQIAMSRVKETNHFCWLVEGADDTQGVSYPVRGDAEYAEQFAHAQPEQLRGEASPRYLYLPGVPERIAADAPQARLIAILRNPVERAWSNWMGRHDAGVERRSFERSIEAESQALDAPVRPGEHSILRVGFYHHHLSRFLDVVPADRLRVLLFDDFQTAPDTTLTELLRFLGVDASASIDVSVRFNPTGVPRNRLVDRMTAKSPLTAALKAAMPAPLARPLHKAALRLRASNRARPEMSAEARARLHEIYREDTLRLQTLLGRDLSGWLGQSDP